MHVYFLQKSNIFTAPTSNMDYPFLLGIKLKKVDATNTATSEVFKLAFKVTTQGLTNFTKYLDSLSSKGPFKEGLITLEVVSEPNKLHYISAYPTNPYATKFCLETCSVSKTNTVEQILTKSTEDLLEIEDLDI